MKRIYHKDFTFKCCDKCYATMDYIRELIKIYFTQYFVCSVHTSSHILNLFFKEEITFEI